MPWIQLLFNTDPETAPRLADLLDDLGAEAVTMVDAADQPLYEPPLGTTPLWSQTRVTALFPADTDAGVVAAEVAEGLAPTPLPQWSSELLDDQDWHRAWMDRFTPLRFGHRLWIVPSWHTPPDPDAINILLDPGLAFGTGTHPTTRLCLEWLESHPHPGGSVVDYGCGSGILAIAAAKLGAARVVGVDNDPQALLATRENAERNGVSESIETYSPEEVPKLSVDLVIANILAGPLADLAVRFSVLVRAGGKVVLSGILADQAESVVQAYLPWFTMETAVESEGWVRLEGQRHTS